MRISSQTSKGGQMFKCQCCSPCRHLRFAAAESHYYAKQRYRDATNARRQRMGREPLPAVLPRPIEIVQTMRATGQARGMRSRQI